MLSAISKGEVTAGKVVYRTPVCVGMGKSRGLEFTESLLTARSFTAVLGLLGVLFSSASENVLLKATSVFFLLK